VAEPEPTEEDPLSRPLPSVDMPLLRTDRRASKVRGAGLALAGLLLVTASVIGLVYFEPDRASSGASAETGESAADAGEMDEMGTSPAEPVSGEPTAEAPRPAPEPRAESPEPEEPSVPPSAPELVPVPASDPSATRQETSFGQARGFRDALQRFGFTREEASELEGALEGVLDFRRCRPEDRMILERNARGQLTTFEYHNNSVEYVLVRRRRDGSLRARQVERPTQTRRLEVGGTVQTSLGDALREAGLARRVVGEFIEAFDGRINFTADTRAGDTFRIIVNEERLDGRFLRYGTVHALEYNGQRTGQKRAFWFEPRGRTAEFHDEEGRPVYGRWLRTPCRYDRISSPFDPRRVHPILNRVMPHNGVDYAAATGTTVWAAADGTVTWAGERGANGNLVSIEHADGYSTHYAHLHRIASGIERGTVVQQRQTIGQVGSTGRSTGPHLHFGLKLRGRFIDPLPEINGPGRPMPAPDLRRYQRHIRTLGQALDRISPGSSREN